MEQSTTDQIARRLKHHEGLRLSSYLCPTGHWTIGWGHNLDSNPVPGIPAREGVTITEDQAERLLMADIRDMRQRVLAKLPWAEEEDDVRLAVLIEAAFSLGVGALLGFKRMLRAWKAGDHLMAALEILDSKPGRGEGTDKDGNPVHLPGLARRYEELSHMLALGEWPGGGD